MSGEDFFDLGEDIIDELGEDGIVYQKSSERRSIRGILRSHSMRMPATETGEVFQTDELFLVIFEPHIAPWVVSSRDSVEVRGTMFDIVSPHRYANGVVKLRLVEASNYDGARPSRKIPASDDKEKPT
jgi:hypothetical protein